MFDCQIYKQSESYLHLSVLRWNEADESAKSSLSSTSRPCFLWVETKENILLSKDSQPLHNQLSYVNSAVLVHNDKSVLPDHCILSYFSEYDCIYLTLLNLSVLFVLKCLAAIHYCLSFIYLRLSWLVL